LNLWDHPPFEPVIKNGRIYARGVADDKGNLFIPIIVVEAMLKTSGRLPVNLKFLFEGQEELGSPQLPGFIEKHKDLLSCDLVLSADGGQWDEDHPGLVLGTRGLAAVFLDVDGPDHDLHSGTYGGTIANPLTHWSKSWTPCTIQVDELRWTGSTMMFGYSARKNELK
jgi:acetylornithine deacetylase/succinyl-diaminopimelate desuccinylase-like protein